VKTEAFLLFIYSVYSIYVKLLPSLSNYLLNVSSFLYVWYPFTAESSL